MKVLVRYQESVIPDVMEDITEKIEFLDGEIQFYAVMKKKRENVEKVSGIKETVETITLIVDKKDYSDKNPIFFKPRDRVFIMGKEYRIASVSDGDVPVEHQNKVAKNPFMYDRYVTKVLTLA